MEVPNIPLLMGIATADVQLSFPGYTSSAGRAGPGRAAVDLGVGREAFGVDRSFGNGAVG